MNDAGETVEHFTPMTDKRSSSGSAREDAAAHEADDFERGRQAGKEEAALETRYGSFRAHVQVVISEARKVRSALEGDKLADGLGAALNAHDDFIKGQSVLATRREGEAS